MHRFETGLEGRALNTAVSNQPESAAFASARAAALRVMGADALRDAVFLEGGLAPWLASDRDLGRLHSDVDFSVRLRDMPAVREWLAGEGLYDRALDPLMWLMWLMWQHFFRQNYERIRPASLNPTGVM